MNVTPNLINQSTTSNYTSNLISNDKQQIRLVTKLVENWLAAHNLEMLTTMIRQCRIDANQGKLIIEVKMDSAIFWLNCYKEQLISYLDKHNYSFNKLAII